MLWEDPKQNYLSHSPCVVHAIVLSVRSPWDTSNRKCKLNLLKQLEFNGLQIKGCTSAFRDSLIQSSKGSKRVVLTFSIPQIYSLVTVFASSWLPHPQGIKTAGGYGDSSPTGNSNSPPRNFISFWGIMSLLAQFMSTTVYSVCPDLTHRLQPGIQGWRSAIHISEAWGKVLGGGCRCPTGKSERVTGRKVKGNKSTILHYRELSASCAVLGQLCFSFSNPMMNCLRRRTTSSSIYSIRSTQCADRYNTCTKWAQHTFAEFNYWVRYTHVWV